jgi:hypothetical protein
MAETWSPPRIRMFDQIRVVERRRLFPSTAHMSAAVNKGAGNSAAVLKLTRSSSAAEAYCSPSGRKVGARAVLYRQLRDGRDARQSASASEVSLYVMPPPFFG